jgi:hypothetical protein
MTNGESKSVLERLLDPISRTFTTETAKAIANLEVDSVARARVDELAEKCNEGQLTHDEQREYETYVHAGNLIGILQAKARLYLKQHPAS